MKQSAPKVAAVASLGLLPLLLNPFFIGAVIGAAVLLTRKQ